MRRHTPGQSQFKIWGSTITAGGAQYRRYWWCLHKKFFLTTSTRCPKDLISIAPARGTEGGGVVELYDLPLVKT